jgi:hypothetical protein
LVFSGVATKRAPWPAARSTSSRAWRQLASASEVERIWTAAARYGAAGADCGDVAVGGSLVGG